MTYKKIIDSGYNELYNEIFCDLFPSNNGYKTCSNCNFGGDQKVYTVLDSKGEIDCQNKCTQEPYCTSYSFDTSISNKNCTQYMTFPKNIINNVNKINSGYAVKKFGYNYNNLTPEQKLNIKNKCTNQYLNNVFTPQNKNIDLTKCLSYQDENNLTKLNMDAKCVYDIYKSNNIDLLISNNKNYNNKINNNEVKSQSDPIIDQQFEVYTKFYDSKDKGVKLNKEYMARNAINFIDNDQNVSIKNNILNNNFNNTLEDNYLINKANDIISTSLGINEHFENSTKKNNVMFLFLIIFTILFLFYVFRKK
jgi:hypothetical protein